MKISAVVLGLVLCAGLVVAFVFSSDPLATRLASPGPEHHLPVLTRLPFAGGLPATKPVDGMVFVTPRIIQSEPENEDELGLVPSK